ncbi:MAG: DUF2911 domain-containing protein [Chitinophagaceae bacterium]
MKRLFLVTVLAGFLMNCSQGQQSPRVSAEGIGVKVSYGQPSKKGREIFGALVPYGEVWRTGANEATEITFSKDTKFGGQSVKAGTYSLFTIPGEKEWTIILNSELKQWGAYEYSKIKAKDVLQVKVPVQKAAAVVEKLTITLADSKMTISWDTTQVEVKIG